MSHGPVEILGSPVLRVSCHEVGFPLSGGALDAIDHLRTALSICRADLGFGRGIAAPQVGSPLRIVHTHLDRPRTLINPKIVGNSEEKFRLWDDCLSLPDLLTWVERFETIEVEYLDPEGCLHRWIAEGDPAELLQHEIDHLDGILMIDRAFGPNAVYAREEYRRQLHTDPDLRDRGPAVGPGEIRVQ